MKLLVPKLGFCAGLLAAALLSGCATNQPTTLKAAFNKHFYVGVAINRNIATGDAVHADNVNRTPQQIDKDIALVKEQFNQIFPENDMKWARIHPRPGPDGYDFGLADAFVNFGLSNNMYLVGHTLVWHYQTPNWVFAGTNPPPASPTPRPAPSRTRMRPGQMGWARTIWPWIWRWLLS